MDDIDRAQQNPSCSEDPDVKGTETLEREGLSTKDISCSEDPDVKGTETLQLRRTLI